VGAEIREIDEGGFSLPYELRRTARSRTVAITVEPSQRIVVRAPHGIGTDRIEAILRRRLPWVRRQRGLLETLPSPLPPRQWVTGETHRYLGRQYRLRIQVGAEPGVRLVGRHFLVTLPNMEDRRQVELLMTRWYRERAAVVLQARIEWLARSVRALELKGTPSFTVKPLRQRWGSTTAGGRITFNLEAMQLPAGCLEYVVMHELVHLRIPSHGPAFWRMLDRCMPDWRKWRERLMRVEV
jgi:predicted metal-dependent hydrolase